MTDEIRISELEEVLSVDNDDVLPIDVDTGGSVIATRKVKVANLLRTDTKTILVDVIGFNNLITAQNNLYAIPIPSSLDYYYIISAHAFLETPDPTTTVEVDIKKHASDSIFTTTITVDPTDYSSHGASVQPVINPLEAQVRTGNWLWFSCLSAGTVGRGLYIALIFSTESS